MMKRIMVIGCPGSGKSTFCRELHKATGIALYHLDMMYWNNDKTTVEKTVFRQRLSEVISRESWIIDGNYGSTMEMRMIACDTVFFLDYPLQVCLDGIRMRKGKPRTDMPWVEAENEESSEEFIDFIKNYDSDSRPKVMSLLHKYQDRNVFIFKKRDDAEKFIDEYIRSRQK